MTPRPELVRPLSVRELSDAEVARRYLVRLDAIGTTAVVLLDCGIVRLDGLQPAIPGWLAEREQRVLVRFARAEAVRLALEPGELLEGIGLGLPHEGRTLYFEVCVATLEQAVECYVARLEASSALAFSRPERAHLARVLRALHERRDRPTPRGAA